MKLKSLAISLQKVAGFTAPNAALEQYMTPPALAARMLFDAYMKGDIEGMKILDLGCGTGMLSLGSALLGGDVTGIDTETDFDTVVMKTPTGAQKEHVDWPFIETALHCAPGVYSEI